mgnify:CR=1 FL=1
MFGHHERVRVLDPLPYPTFLALLASSHGVLTNSLSVLEDAQDLVQPNLFFWAGFDVPEGFGRTIFADSDVKGIRAGFESWLRIQPTWPPSDEATDGKVANRIVCHLRKMLFEPADVRSLSPTARFLEARKARACRSRILAEVLG